VASWLGKLELLWTKERVMSRKFLPKITLSASDRLRLERLVCVAAAGDQPAVRFLLAEIGRAEIVPDGANELEMIVTMGSSVTYRLNWNSRAETRKLVYPEEYSSDRSHILVLSPLGAALIGLRSRSRMPYFTTEGWMYVVEAENVSRSMPNVIPTVPSHSRGVHEQWVRQ
jgi:regulator of nucleoside diphosphate kinase